MDSLTLTCPPLPFVRERFLPAILPTDRTYPFKVSYRLLKRQGVISFTLAAPVRWTRGLVAALDLLTSLGQELQRGAEGSERALRVNADAVAWQKRQRGICRAYSTFRKRGLLHRAAVRALVSDPRFQDLSWGFSDFNRIVPSASEWKR